MSSAINSTTTKLQPRLWNYLLLVPSSRQMPTENYKVKIFCPVGGPQDTWGHSSASVDESTTFRVFLQNPNGLALYPMNYSLL